MKVIKVRRSLSFMLSIILTILLCGCSFNKDIKNENKELIFGTTLNTKSLDPANGYCGWFLVRYGVGETLFKLNDNMEIEPWLAECYEYLDKNSLKIKIKDNVKFHNGRKLTGEAVKLSLERTVSKNARAAALLKISSIDAYEDYIIIKTSSENPTLINDLCDPFAAILDVLGTGIDVSPIGTGAFKVEKFTHTGSSTFIKNEEYWDGEVKLDKLKVMPITDADMLSMALQSGEIDAAQGLAYSMVELFSKNESFKINTVDTSRTVVLYFNEKNKILENKKVRQAINNIININKENYCTSILNGQASPAISMFPQNTNYSLKKVYNNFSLEEVANILREEGCIDSDNDGILEKDGEKLSFKLVTYSSRTELPGLAQAIQHDLKSIGINITIDIQENIADVLSAGQFELALYSNITSSTGDAAVYLSNAVKTNGSSNYGSYTNKKVDELINRMNIEIDKDIRDESAMEIQEIVLKDEAYNFLAHMKMSFAMKNNVTGLNPHPTDYYQFNVNTDIE